MINITSFKDIVLSKSGGKPLSKVSNLYSLIYEAMIKVKSQVDLPSAKRSVQLTNPVYSDILSYPLPLDTTIGGLINLRPITPDISYYDFTSLNSRQMTVEEKFSTTSKRYALRMVNGVQTLMIKDITTSPVIIHNCESLSENGVVVGVGATTNVAVDGLQKVAGSNSISFEVGIGTTNGIEDASLTSVDLSEQLDILFFAFIPSITNVTGLQITLGQSSLINYSGSTATDFFGNALVAGWNLIRIPKTAMSTTGSPSWSAVTYFKYNVLGNFPAILSGFRIDSLVGQIGAIYEIDYYSDYQFQDISGTRLVKPSSDTDQILVSGDELDLFTDQFIELMTVDLKQQGVNIEMAVYGGKNLASNYENFQMKHPSERQLMTTQIGSNPAAFINS